MHRPSIYASILSLLLLSSSFSIAQQTKQWSVGGALGSATQLSLSYKVHPQWQLSFDICPIGDLARTNVDRVGLSIIYYLDTSDSPIFIGFAPGISDHRRHPFITVIPVGVQHKITDDFSITLAAELFRATDNIDRPVAGLGISVGGSINL